MLEEALPRWMLIEIEDQETGLNNINLHDIFDHAFDRKGQINNGLVDEYTTAFNAQLDMPQGINGYVERQEECHDFFLDAGRPATDQQLSAKGQLHVGQTGLFKDKYLVWKRRTAAQKTWNNFKTYWTREFTNDETVNCPSAKDARFGANTATQVTESTMSELEEAMDGLVYATTTSNSVLEMLTNTNK
eukprot:2735885-Ditylum_brightwellii.AAC.1